MNRFHRGHAGWMVKIWVILTVFVLPFLSAWHVFAWLAIGGVAGLAWKFAPEAPPEKPVDKLPYHDQYADRQIPKPEE